jgi:hypothetical protein
MIWGLASAGSRLEADDIWVVISVLLCGLRMW